MDSHKEDPVDILAKAAQDAREIIAQAADNARTTLASERYGIRDYLNSEFDAQNKQNNAILTAIAKLDGRIDQVFSIQGQQAVQMAAVTTRIEDAGKEASRWSAFITILINVGIAVWSNMTGQKS